MPVANTNRYIRVDGGDLQIATAKGDLFIIDAKDEGVARKHCWSRHQNGYARAVTRIGGRLKTVYLHRLICRTDEHHPHVDHVDGNPSNCRRHNLRPCTRAENMWNQKIRADNCTGFKGVGFHKPSGKFRARARASGRVISRGLFESAAEASSAAEDRRIVLHGEFARHG